jgi:DNA repair protein RecO (recombination protein O)
VAEALKLSGVVLRTVDYGESDRVVTLLTAERGKLAAFARGARASRRRFGGALEPFGLVRAEARERRGADLVWLESVSVERAHGGIRGELGRIACAGYACELSRELVRDHEPHPELLALLVAYLGRLDAGPARQAALRAFELGALEAAGLMPRLDACARCGGALDAAGAALVAREAAATPSESPAPARALRHAFDPAHGGTLCLGCGPSANPAAPRLGPATVAAALRLQAGGLAASDVEPLAAPAGAELRDALSRFLEHHLGARLHSRKFLDEIAPMMG